MYQSYYFFSHQKGNALFLILIAVALFAALSYAVTQSGRGSGDTDSEQALLHASEITQYMGSVRDAVTRMRTLYGCSETDISLENAIVANYDNDNLPPDSCKVFHVDGGAVEYIVPKEIWLDSTHSSEAIYQTWYFPDRTCVNGVGAGSGTDCQVYGSGTTDLIMFLPYVSEEICSAFNKGHGVSTSGTPPAMGANPYPSPAQNFPFKGTYSSGRRITGAEFVGQMEGCGSFGGGYHVYVIVLPR